MMLRSHRKRKILVVGGYGVFGRRLAELLARDGHDVCIAGRSESRAKSAAREIGCAACAFDRAGDLAAIAGFDLVVDAAGPFHSYGDDPYRLPKAAIAAGVHYLDLSDNAAFCAGITALDEEARRAGVSVLSGLSSVPALSSAAVIALSGGSTPRMIDTAILPGNRAPRGFSVMHSILTQAGQPMREWRGGEWDETYGWSDPRCYDLPDGVARQGWVIEVPDTTLFPAHFGAGSVRFRAGLELGVFRYGLAALARLRRICPVPVGPRLVRVAKAIADPFATFGTGRGGMSVTVLADQTVHCWTMLAEDGQGPFIPAVPVRALLRRSALPPGAGPAIGAITLDEAEAAMSDLTVTTQRRDWPWTPLFQAVLGAEFAVLPDRIRETHMTADRSCWQGRAEIERGAGVVAACLALFFGAPKAGSGIEVRVVKTVTTRGETWERQFGQVRFRSHLAVQGGELTERFGPLTFGIRLGATQETLQYPVISGRLGPIPLPRWALPVSDAEERVEDGRFHFDVAVRAPLTRSLVIRYRGWLTRSGDVPRLPPTA